MLMGDIHRYLDTRETGHRMVEVDDIPDLSKLIETYLQSLQATGPVNLVGDAVSSSGVGHAAAGRLAGSCWPLIRPRNLARSVAV
jgi:hypothetical protein